jgi:hypothetical protein
MQSPLFPRFREDTPTFDDVHVEMRPLLSLLFRALEFGAVKNHAYFDEISDGEKPRPYVREIIVKDHAHRHLRDHGVSVEEDHLWVLQEPLRALAVRYNDTHLRVLKAKNGRVPGCGNQRIRRRFYNQWPSHYQDLDGEIVTTKWNLLLLWDFDAAFNIGKVWLAFPVRAGSRSADVVCAWMEEIQHPATDIVIPIEDPKIAAQDERDLRSLLEEKPKDQEERDDEASSSA